MYGIGIGTMCGAMGARYIDAPTSSFEREKPPLASQVQHVNKICEYLYYKSNWLKSYFIVSKHAYEALF